MSVGGYGYFSQSKTKSPNDFLNSTKMSTVVSMAHAMWFQLHECILNNSFFFFSFCLCKRMQESYLKSPLPPFTFTLIYLQIPT